MAEAQTSDAAEMMPNEPRWMFDSSIPQAERLRFMDAAVAALKTVFDPEIPCDIYELGLIYKIDIDDHRNVGIVMTLTAPGCPVAGEMPQWVENAVARRYGRRSDEGHAHLRPAVGQGSHVGRSKAHAQYVLTAHLERSRIRAEARQ